MYRLKKLILILFVITAFSCDSQEKQDFYLLFKPNVEKHCNHSMFRNGDNKKPIKYKDQKLIEHNNIFFEMCNTRLANYNGTVKKTIDNLDGIKIVNISDINTIVEKYWSNDTLEKIPLLNIYVLEKTKKEKYNVYKVKIVENIYR